MFWPARDPYPTARPSFEGRSGSADQSTSCAPYLPQQKYTIQLIPKYSTSTSVTALELLVLYSYIAAACNRHAPHERAGERSSGGDLKETALATKLSHQSCHARSSYTGAAMTSATERTTESTPLIPTNANAEGTYSKGFRFMSRAVLVVSAVGCCYMLVALASPRGVVQEDQSQIALKPEIIDRINNAGLSWTAHIPEGFKNAAHKDLKRLSGGRRSTGPRSKHWKMSEYATAGNQQPAALGTFFRGLGAFLGLDYFGQSSASSFAQSYDPTTSGLPASFDARAKWPACAGIIGTARDQGNCGSCWAMAPAEVMSDRLCIESQGAKQVKLSPYQLLSCSSAADTEGCDGGHTTVAYDTAKANGIVSVRRCRLTSG